MTFRMTRKRKDDKKQKENHLFLKGALSASGLFILMKRQAEREAILYHTVPWLCIMIPDRLAVGPSLEAELDAKHLHQVLKVTDIVNIKPATDKMTSSGKSNITNWYECHMDGQTDENGDALLPPTFHRIPVLPTLKTMNEKQQVKFYVEMARRVAKVLLDDTHAFLYIHNTSGCEEEAFVAFLVWLIIDKKTFPPDITTWMKQNYQERLLDSEESRATLALAIKEIRGENVFLKNWLVKKK